jgi:hypothetical protein
MNNKPPEGNAPATNFPLLFRFNAQERQVILPYLLARWKCKGKLSTVLHRALLIAHEHESALEARERREPFIDTL